MIASHIHWAKIDDVVVALDERRGRYLGLCPEQTALFLQLLSTGSEQSNDPIVRSFLLELRTIGWIDHEYANGTGTSTAGRTRRPSLLYALACLLRANVDLRIKSFAAAYTWAKRAAATSTNARATHAMLDRALEAFTRAEHIMITRRGLEDCLPRTLALYRFLRTCGFPVSHHIGVRRYPFSAHAWVQHPEIGVLLDTNWRVSIYTCLASLP